MGAEGAVDIIFRKQVEAAEDPAAKQRRADRGLPQDHRRLHRGRQRDDRRRHRPARDAADDLPRARDGRATSGSSGRGSGTAWCRYEASVVGRQSSAAQRDARQAVQRSGATRCARRPARSGRAAASLAARRAGRRQCSVSYGASRERSTSSAPLVGGAERPDGLRDVRADRSRPHRTSCTPTVQPVERCPATHRPSADLVGELAAERRYTTRSRNATSHTRDEAAHARRRARA